MYRVPRAVKADPVRRWGLPDRVFFACGACHILAHTAIRRWPEAGFEALWIRPVEGFTGNHIVAVAGGRAVDYHGWSDWERLLAHTRAKARRWWPGWDCTIMPLAPEVLVSEALTRRHEGLWLREPGQFLHDPMRRAERFLDRLPVEDPLCGSQHIPA